MDKKYIAVPGRLESVATDGQIAGASQIYDDIAQTKQEVLNEAIRDKEYAPASFSGLGRKFLRKNISDNKNILTQDMMNTANTIYVIQYDYDLNGQTITVPEGCVLEFGGGSLKNGTLAGTTTKLNYSAPAFENITISGTWNVPKIHSWIMKDITAEDKLRDLFRLGSDDVQNTFYLHKNEDNYIVVPTGEFTYSGIDIPANTNVQIAGIVQIKTNPYPRYSIFNIKKDNITIDGGELIGDRETHDYSDQTHPTHEWGHGITSTSAVNNVTIKNIHLHHFTGDCISVSGHNVIIENVIIHESRRQGITVGNIIGGIINNFEIYNIGLGNGTAPKSCIDIEPNTGEVRDLTITNGHIHASEAGMNGLWVYANQYSNFHDLTISNITEENVTRALCFGGVGPIQNVRCSDITINHNVAANNTNNTYIIQVSNGNNFRFKNVNVTTSPDGDGVSQFILWTTTDASDIQFENCIFQNTEYKGTFGFVAGTIFKDCKFISGIILGDYYEARPDNYADTFINCYMQGVMNICADGFKFDNCTIVPPSNIDGLTYIIVNRGNRKNILFERCKFDVTQLPLSNFKAGSVSFKSCNFINSVASTVPVTVTTGFASIIDCSISYGGILQRNAGNTSCIIEKGTTAYRPTSLKSKDAGFKYYDTNLGKTVSLAKANSEAIISETVNNETKFVENTLVEGKEYNLWTGNHTSYKYAAAFSKLNEVSEDPDDLYTIQYSTESNVQFEAISSEVYPYIMLKTSRNVNAHFNFYELVDRWLDSDGFTANIKSGTTAQRPTSTLLADDAGYEYFDTTLGKPIYFNGTGWVDATGTAV